MSNEMTIAVAIYTALYLVKVRYVVTAAMYFCFRLQNYGIKTPLATGSDRMDVYVFSTISLIITFVLLIPMALIEKASFFEPYDREILDKVAHTAEEE